MNLVGCPGHTECPDGQAIRKQVLLFLCEIVKLLLRQEEKESTCKAWKHLHHTSRSMEKLRIVSGRQWEQQIDQKKRRRKLKTKILGRKLQSGRQGFSQVQRSEDKSPISADK